MTDRERLLAYLTALVAVFFLAVVLGRLIGPSLGGVEHVPAPENHPAVILP